ncbi:CCC motif membrane protein [Flavobacterium chuncheonense]|uniref:CCC motif membrane protein n=1 Tax=Flavobacterium chuncheonense TaxID=2026653 RepID=A0ABW5YJN9_9FLAO
MQNQKLPNATAVLILGIFSILTCCCYGVIGLTLGIIGLVLANKDIKLYQQDPTLYSNYNNLKIGRILAIIGITISTLYLVYVIVLFSTIGQEGLMDMYKEMMRRNGIQ